MTTKTDQLRLAKVKLVEGGLKGLILTYEQTEIRNNREFYTEFPGVKKKFPIHRELEECFLWLRKYLLEICDYPQDESFINQVEMTAITYTDKGFVLSGKLQVLNMNKVIALNTPLVTAEDEYKNYAGVTKILDGIYAETKEYVAGKKMMSDTEIVIRYNKGNQEFDINTFSALSNEEQMRIATEVMQKNKCMVFTVDEIGGEEDKESETFNVEPFPPVVISEAPKEEVIIAPVIVEANPFGETLPPEETIWNENIELNMAKENEPLLVEVGDDFHINFKREPAKVSTATKKK